MPSELRGVIPAMVTPRDDARDDVDLAALRALTAHLLASGVHGLFPTSSTGEAPLLTPDQRQARSRRSSRRPRGGAGAGGRRGALHGRVGPVGAAGRTGRRDPRCHPAAALRGRVPRSCTATSPPSPTASTSPPCSTTTRRGPAGRTSRLPSPRNWRHHTTSSASRTAAATWPTRWGICRRARRSSPSSPAVRRCCTRCW